MKKTLLTLLAAGTLALTACQNNTQTNANTNQQEDTMKAIPQTDATVLVLVAHPDISKSTANAALAKAAADVKGVQVVNIYDYPVSPETYKEVVSRAKTIVYQFPFYWMAAPHLMKQWTDEVFMAYAGDDNQVRGKHFLVCCTTGSDADAYRHGGRNKYTIEEYLRPYEGQANHAEMIWEQPLAVYGQHPGGSKDELEKGCKAYQERLKALVEASR